MSSIAAKRHFIETRESIYKEAETIAKCEGIPALVDALLGWADDAFHMEVFKDLADTAAIDRCRLRGC